MLSNLQIVGPTDGLTSAFCVTTVGAVVFDSNILDLGVDVEVVVFKGESKLLRFCVGDGCEGAVSVGVF